MLALTEQSVFTCLLLARPSVHILLNSPVTANAAVASPSTNAPASADVTNVLCLGRLLWGFRPLGQQTKRVGGARSQSRDRLSDRAWRSSRSAPALWRRNWRPRRS